MANRLCGKKAAPSQRPARTVVDRLTLHINFDPDKSDIRKAEVPELQKAVDFVKKYPDSKFSVEGYTEDRGTDEYKQKLSERRAHAVERYLVDNGHVKADRITAVGKGKADPVGDNTTGTGRFRNRRVEILIIGD